MKRVAILQAIALLILSSSALAVVYPAGESGPTPAPTPAPTFLVEVTFTGNSSPVGETTASVCLSLSILSGMMQFDQRFLVIVRPLTLTCVLLDAVLRCNEEDVTVTRVRAYVKDLVHVAICQTCVPEHRRGALARIGHGLHATCPAHPRRSSNKQEDSLTFGTRFESGEDYTVSVQTQPPRVRLSFFLFYLTPSPSCFTLIFYASPLACFVGELQRVVGRIWHYHRCRCRGCGQLRSVIAGSHSFSPSPKTRAIETH